MNENQHHFHLNDFLKQVLKKIMQNKQQGNLKSHPTIPRPSYYSSPTATQMPLFNNSKKRKQIRRRGRGGNDKQLDLPFDTDSRVSMIPKPYTNSKKWLSDVFDKDWTYKGYDLTGYPTGLLPKGAYTPGNTIENEIYQEAVLANPDIFMADWNDALKLKISDMKNRHPEPPSTSNSEEDVSTNEIISMINEIVAEELSEINGTTDSSGKVIAAVGAPGSVMRFATENPDLIKQMREWVKDCQWADLAEEDVDELSEEELLRGIQNNYDGGIREFIRNSNSVAEVPVGYKESLNEIMHPDDEADLAGDGYSNEYQRAFAHSQATTPRKNELQKAKDLAKTGKFVIISTYPVYCKATDACLGSETVIYKVFNTQKEAMDVFEKLNDKGIDYEGYDLITPDSIKEPEKIKPKDSGDDDVPFEGVGYVYDKDMKKDPKHIPGERWRVKFQESKEPYADQVKRALRSAEDQGDAEATLYYSQLLKKPTVASVAFDKFKGSHLYNKWKQDNATNIEHEKKKRSNPWLWETITRRELKDIIKSVITESREEGKPLPKDAAQITALIQRLKEGEYIWFSYDKMASSGHGYGVQCKAEGDYLMHRTIGEYGEYLETDEDIENYAKEVASDKWANYYLVLPIQGYKKVGRSSYNDDDQSPGHYELYGPDRPDWREIYENKNSLKEIITGYDDMIEIIKQMTPEQQAELNNFIKNQQGVSAYDAVLSYFEQKAQQSPQS